MEKKEFLVGGMHCNSCAQLIEIGLQDLQGLKTVKVDFSSERATVEFDGKKTSEREIIKAITEAGYSVRPARGR